MVSYSIGVPFLMTLLMDNFITYFLFNHFWLHPNNFVMSVIMNDYNLHSGSGFLILRDTNVSVRRGIS